jgi:DNA-binding FadR family transcriptional regulator
MTSGRALTKTPEVRRPKAAETVAAEIRRQIVTGRLKPGDKLHPESVLQAEFGISRPTLREALRLLEFESLITISRGQGGGARVTAIDLGAVARQVGVFLQVDGTTLEDVWFARTVLEPPAVGLLAKLRDPLALTALAENVAAAREVAESDPIRYADLSAEFSLLLTRLCGNHTIHLLSALIHDIIRRQHANVTARTLANAGVARLRRGSLDDRERALALIRAGDAEPAERFWREHLEHMRDLVLQAYDTPMTIDVLSEPVGRMRAVARVRRQTRSMVKAA